MGQAIACGQVNVIQWAIKVNIPLTQSLANISVETNNVNILNLLYTQGILPSSLCFAPGVTTRSGAAIRWAIARGIRVPDDIDKRIHKTISNDQKLVYEYTNDFKDNILPIIKDDLF